MAAPAHVLAELPEDDAPPEVRNFARQTAWLLGGSPFWHTSLLVGEKRSPVTDTHEEIEAGLRSRPVLGDKGNLSRIDFAILYRPRPLPLARRTIKIFRIHDLVSPQMWTGADSAGISHGLAAIAEKSYFACASEVIRESLVEHRPSIRHRTYIVPQSLPLLEEEPSDGKPVPGPYFIAVGPIQARSNYARMVEGFRRARGLQDSARHLVIVGEFDGDEEARRAIETGAGEGWITWERPAGQGRLIHLLRGAYALVAAPLAEPLGLAALQAAALGVPAAVSDLRLFRSNFDDAAEFFDPLDPASIAAALLRLSTAQAHAHFALYAPSRAEPFQPENELAHWQELFRSLGRRAEIPAVSPRRIVGWQPKKIESAVPLTVVMGGDRVDDRIYAALDILVLQAKAAGAEIVLGTQEPFPDRERYPGVRFFTESNTDVPTLRARGASMARGEIVAITEDHGVVPGNWCARLIEEHRRHPESAVVYGTVRHGGPYTLTSWANFYSTFGVLMPPLDFPPRRRIPPIVNVSIKRSFAPVAWESGWFEFVGLPTLYDIGLCHLAGDLAVDHIQHHGLLGTYWAHLHNARVTTGLRGLKRGSAAWRAHLADSLRVPRQSLLDWRDIWRKREPRARLLAALPAYTLIALMQTAGEIAGLFFGAGDSAKFLD